MSRPLSILATLILATIAAAARNPVGIAFYDVDRIYDTIPALFYDCLLYTSRCV